MTTAGSASGFLARFAEITLDRPDKPAIVSRHGRLTFAELDALARRCSRLLPDAAKPGHHVLIVARRPDTHVAALLGILRRGHVAAPLAPMTREDDLAVMLEALSPLAIVTDVPDAPRIRPLLTRAQIVHPGLPIVEIQDDGPTQRLPDPRVRPAPNDQTSDFSPGADDPALVIHTTGSTSTPKGVVHTHGALAARLLDLGAGELTWLTSLGLYTAAGHATLTQALLGGDTLVALDTFDPRETLDGVDEHGVNVLALTPRMLEFLAQVARRGNHDLSTLVFVGVGGAPLDADVARRAAAALDCVVVASYGSSELGGPVLTSHAYVPGQFEPAVGTDAPTPAGERGLVRAGAPLFDAEVRVVDAAGEDVRPGEVGELACRTAGMMHAYTMPGDMGTRFQDGWLLTGDVAVQGSDSQFCILGRKDEVVFRHGRKVFPAVVSRELERMEGINEAAVTGLRLEADHDELWAFVSTASAPDDLHSTLRRDGDLQPHEIPDVIVVCEALPRTADGTKTDLRTLRDWASAHREGPRQRRAPRWEPAS